MSSRSVTYETDELATLVQIKVGETQDHLSKQLPLLDAYHRIYGKSGLTKDGGQKWRTDVEVAEHSSLTGLPTGYEPIDLTVVGIFQSMIFAPGFVTAPFLSSIVERATFNGSAEAKAGIARRAANVVSAVMRYTHQHWIAGGVSAFTTGGWGTLNGTDVSTGYIEEDAHGSQGNTVGGLSKSTWASVSGMNNFSYDLADSVGSNGREAVIYTRNLVRERVTDMSKLVWLASIQGGTNFAKVMLPHMNYSQKESPDIIGPDAKFNGQDYYTTSDMPISGTNTVTYEWSVLAIDMGMIYPVFLKNNEIDGLFGVVPMNIQHSGDRRVNVGYCDCAGQLMAERFNSSALFYRGEIY